MPAMITFSSVRVTVFQTVVLLLLVLGMSVVGGKTPALSVALGGLVSIVPVAWFGYSVFRHRGAQAMTKVVRSAFIGEGVKLLMMGAGFALIFVFVDSREPAAVFGGFIATHVAGLLAIARQMPRT